MHKSNFQYTQDKLSVFDICEQEEEYIVMTIIENLFILVDWTYAVKCNLNFDFS